MKIKSDYESILSLELIEITESQFRKKDGLLGELELDLQVKTDFKELDDSIYEVFLSTTIADEEKNLYVYVKGRALFRIEQYNQELLEKNTLAIMFPYIRSYISMITTQPGMPPIILPPMNIIAMIDNQK